METNFSTGNKCRLPLKRSTMHRPLSKTSVAQKRIVRRRTMHFIEICRICGKVISQCRCMDCNKERRTSICSDCASKMNDESAPSASDNSASPKCLCTNCINRKGCVEYKKGIRAAKCPYHYA